MKSFSYAGCSPWKRTTLTPDAFAADPFADDAKAGAASQ